MSTQNLTDYVKALEKLKWVKTLIGEEICMLNLDDFNYSNIDNLYRTNTKTNLCYYHRCNDKKKKKKTMVSRDLENLLKAYYSCIDEDHRTFFPKMIDELII
uniref:Uncharacterized protein n=1 Tax=Glossina palpalis gambiensis TaxID=67801 RepID=A0A1B0C509_9MUSC